jgi:hypothetical protein
VVRNIAVLWMCEVRMWSTIEWDRTYVFICVRVPYSVVYNNDELKEDILKFQRQIRLEGIWAKLIPKRN